jgi:hypothetical protein
MGVKKITIPVVHAGRMHQFLVTEVIEPGIDGLFVLMAGMLVPIDEQRRGVVLNWFLLEHRNSITLASKDEELLCWLKLKL